MFNDRNCDALAIAPAFKPFFKIITHEYFVENVLPQMQFAMNRSVILLPNVTLAVQSLPPKISGELALALTRDLIQKDYFLAPEPALTLRQHFLAVTRSCSEGKVLAGTLFTYLVDEANKVLQSRSEEHETKLNLALLPSLCALELKDTEMLDKACEPLVEWITKNADEQLSCFPSQVLDCLQPTSEKLKAHLAQAVLKSLTGAQVNLLSSLGLFNFET